jgi:plasmid stabilization system protein ParE
VRIRYGSRARREALDASRWFRKWDASSERRFTERLDEVMRDVADNPHIGRENGDGTRRFPLSPFPYCVVYEVQRGVIVVLAVAHTRQRPGYWSDR